MSGQNRKDPFNVRRDVVHDNALVTKKVNLLNGADVRVNQFSSVTITGPATDATVVMNFAGNLALTVIDNVTDGGVITINNPFVKDDTTPIVLNSQSGTGATLAYVSPGQLTLTFGAGSTPGPYNIGVGALTDARDNGYSQ